LKWKSRYCVPCQQLSVRYVEYSYIRYLVVQESFLPKSSFGESLILVYTCLRNGLSFSMIGLNYQWYFINNDMLTLRYFYKPSLGPVRSGWTKQILPPGISFTFMYIFHGTQMSILAWSLVNLTFGVLEKKTQDVFQQVLHWIHNASILVFKDTQDDCIFLILIYSLPLCGIKQSMHLTFLGVCTNLTTAIRLWKRIFQDGEQDMFLQRNASFSFSMVVVLCYI